MGHGTILTVFHPTQIFVFNGGIDGVGLKGSVGASNARLDASCHNSSDIDPVDDNVSDLQNWFQINS